ncbi:hypothetical protein Hanom_Chr08g00723571 [Helianthus anomalus]
MSYCGGYWAMMVTNPPRGFDPEPHPGFHPDVTSARHLSCGGSTVSGETP